MLSLLPAGTIENEPATIHILFCLLSFLVSLLFVCLVLCYLYSVENSRLSVYSWNRKIIPRRKKKRKIAKGMAYSITTELRKPLPCTLALIASPLLVESICVGPLFLLSTTDRPPDRGRSESVGTRLWFADVWEKRRHRLSECTVHSVRFRGYGEGRRGFTTELMEGHYFPVRLFPFRCYCFFSCPTAVLDLPDSLHNYPDTLIDSSLSCFVFVFWPIRLILLPRKRIDSKREKREWKQGHFHFLSFPFRCSLFPRFGTERRHSTAPHRTAPHPATNRYAIGTNPFLQFFGISEPLLLKEVEEKCSFLPSFACHRISLTCHPYI